MQQLIFLLRPVEGMLYYIFQPLIVKGLYGSQRSATVGLIVRIVYFLLGRFEEDDAMFHCIILHEVFWLEPPFYFVELWAVHGNVTFFVGVNPRG
jgi:hypothetical protein